MKMTNTQRILKALTENEDIMKALANGNGFRPGEYINRNIFNNVNLNNTLPHTDSYIYFDECGFEDKTLFTFIVRSPKDKELNHTTVLCNSILEIVDYIFPDNKNLKVESEKNKYFDETWIDFELYKTTNTITINFDGDVVLSGNNIKLQYIDK